MMGMNKTFYNASGCKDPTASKAIKFEIIDQTRNLEESIMEENQARKKKIKITKAIEKMTAKELKDEYMKSVKRIKYAQKRIEHEENKEFTSVAIKVQSSRKNFPYTQYGAVTSGPDPRELKQSEIVIKKWQQEIKLHEEKQKNIENYIDTIEDAESREVWWMYCINGKTQREIGKEMYLSQSSVFQKLRRASQPFFFNYNQK